MKRLITFVGFVALANIAMMPVVVAEERAGICEENTRADEVSEESVSLFASSEYERKISREFNVGSSPTQMKSTRLNSSH